MTNIVIVGMQWGDEGKGKVVDFLCPAFDVVARYQGGHNAGHTVRFGKEHFALHLIPSGVLQPKVRCVLGNGMVISPEALLKEIDGLKEAGIDPGGRLFLSDRAQLLIQPHALLDRAREEASGESKIGTTVRGIGPAYEIKVSRFGLRMCDLDSPELEVRLRCQLERLEAELARLGQPASLVDEALASCHRFREQLAPYLADTSLELNRWIDAGDAVLFEGAQGSLLDLDHGTYPFVSSSNSTAGGACTGTGVAPTRIGGVLGVLKAYATRVGGGPFPTELTDDTGEHLRQRGNEFGTTTGRPRRCGWLDLVAARYSRRINGIETLALTKLDVLDDLAEIPVCVGYRLGDRLIEEMPADGRALAHAEPVLKVLEGWQTSTVGVLDRADLPAKALEYVRFVESEVGASASLISTGPRREETLVAGGTCLDSWLAPRLSQVLAARG